MSGSVSDLATLQGPLQPPQAQPPKQPKPAPDWSMLQGATKGLPPAANADQLAADRANIEAKEPTMPQLAKPPAPPGSQQTDPLQAFGQPAMWIAALGSLFTRQPFAYAIQAAGAVLKSTSEKDAEQAKYNYENYKIQSENAYKMAQFQQKAYDSAIKKFDVDVKAGKAELETNILRFKDGVLQHAYDHGGYAEVQKLLYARKSQTTAAQTAGAQLDTHLKSAVDRANLIASDDPKEQAQGAVMEAERMAQIAFSVKGDPAAKMLAQQNVDIAKALATRVSDPDPTKSEQAFNELKQRFGLTGSWKPPTAAQQSASTKGTVGYDEKGDQLVMFNDVAGGAPKYKTIAGEDREAPKQFLKTPGLGEDATEFVGEMIAKGNLQAASGLARNATDMAAVKRAAVAYAKSNGLDPDGVNNNILQYTAMHSAAVREGGATGQRLGASTVAAGEAGAVFPLAKQAFAALENRGEFAPLNKLKSLVASGTNSPEQAAAMAQDISAVTTYARALSPNGVAREAEIEKLSEVLSTKGQDAASHNAVLDQWTKDIAAIQGANTETRDHLRTSFGSQHGITGGGQQQSGGSHPAVPPALAGKPGLQWSASKQMFRDSSGQIYDAQGNPQ